MGFSRFVDVVYVEVVMPPDLFGELKLGDLLRRHRKDASLSQKELGQMLDYSDSIVSRVENDEQWPAENFIKGFVLLNALALNGEQQQMIWQLFRHPNGMGVEEKRPFLADWGEAPDVDVFYGRFEELNQLSKWVKGDRSRLLAVLAMGGMGKTWLVTKLAHEVADDFDMVIWRSLRNAPPCEELLQECLQIFSEQQLIEPMSDIHRGIRQLLELFKEKRCLLVLDNAESILEPGQQVGTYRTGYEGYGEFWRILGEAAHQSCIILTSREQPKELARLAGNDHLVHVLPLLGFDSEVGKKFLRNRTLQGDAAAWRTLINRYAGNPLALQTVSGSIEMLYGGDILTFLQEITSMFGEINFLLQQQFERLSLLEQDIMIWLAIVREPISIPELREYLFAPTSSSELAQAMSSLARRSLVETGNGRFTLQNVILEFITNYFVKRCIEEIQLKKISVLNKYPLRLNLVKEYIRASQERIILKPIIESLMQASDEYQISRELLSLIQLNKESTLLKKGFAVGNLINILLVMDFDISGIDLSDLAVWEVDFQKPNIHGVNLKGAHIRNSEFFNTFGQIYSVKFSPDGKYIAAGSANWECRIWDTKNISINLLT